MSPDAAERLVAGRRCPFAICARHRDWGTGWALFEAFKASFVPPA
jgi:hypothetical protein